MLELGNIDLRHDAAAIRYVKHELVQVSFANISGEMISREGLNTYQQGDALIIGSTGDRWSVSRSRFEAKYEPIAGSMGTEGGYRSRPVPVLAKQIQAPFSIARSVGGDLLKGLANDWLLQYAPGDYGVIENARFQQVYKINPVSITK